MAAKKPQSNGDNVVKAEPTKEFFVSMLIRDIDLMAAIIDLIDNSVDGARRHRPKGDYSGLWVRIEGNADRFVVADNCGGMPIDTARNYAFRFGRQAGVERDKHSIGQFGVGMKRALFKLGQRFEIESKTTTDSFKLHVDVRDWAKDHDTWDFTFDDHAEGEKRDLAATGTTLTSMNLHGDVKETFSNEKWVTTLTASLRLKHRDAITRGLRVTLNDQPVDRLPLDVIEATQCRPGKNKRTVRVADATVTVAIVAGVSGSAPDAAGWYVFCNGRMVLGPDKSDVTTWRGGSGTRGLPRYHDEYARFRGYVFFDSDDPSALPWTTTKVGVDQDSRMWVSTRSLMEDMARDIVQFLRDLDRDRDENPDVAEGLDKLKRTPIEKVRFANGQEFRHPKLARSDTQAETLKRISYRRTESELAAAKRLLGVTRAEDVGNLTFDYFMDAEGN